jgi:hypothetical protein
MLVMYHDVLKCVQSSVMYTFVLSDPEFLNQTRPRYLASDMLLSYMLLFRSDWIGLHSQAFHLPTAVALGHCSFEAYNAPPVIHGVKEVDSHGTETVYMDREFMEEVVTGVLAVHLDSAALGFEPDAASDMRPFLTVCLNQSTGGSPSGACVPLQIYLCYEL